MGAAVACLVAIGAISVRRIPEGSVGVFRSGLKPSGWTLGAPWGGMRILPAQGRIEVPNLSVRSREGSSLEFRLVADYSFGRRLEPAFSEAVRSSGLEAAVTAVVGRVLEDASRALPADEILSDPSRLESALRSELLAAGLSLDRVELRTTLADVLEARRRTDEARRLARGREVRLLLVGWDGADWAVIEPLVERGRMPNLARLLRNGAYGRLRSIDPMFSPLLWTTVATGKAPSQHGIADFLVKDPASGQRRPITSDFRRVKALWNILPEFGIPSGWVSWWASYPAEPGLGVIVTNLVAAAVVRAGSDCCAERGDLVYPADYLARRRALLVPPSSLAYEDVRRLFPLTPAEFQDAQARAPTDLPDPASKSPPDPIVFVIKLLCAMRTYHNLALDMIRQGLPVVAVYYEGVDMMGHRFQHYMPPKMEMVSRAEFERFQGAVAAYYELQDEMLGELLAAAGNDTVTIVLSDHGFATGEDRPQNVPPYTSQQPAEWHRPWGILLLHGPPIRPGRIPPASLYDVAPTVLYLAGLPLASDMPGRLLAEAIEPQWLDSRPPHEIPTYELVGSPLARSSGVSLDQQAMAEMVESLRALGYVGGQVSPAGPGPGTESVGPSGQAETQVYYHRNLATHHIKRGAFREAEAELLAANTRRPMPKTYGMLAEVRASQGRYSEAAEALEEGLRTIPDEMGPESLLWLAEMYLSAGSRDEAARVADRFPRLATTAIRDAIRGRIEEEKGAVREAATFYESALREDPLLVNIVLRLQALYRRQGRPEAIEPFLRRGLEASSRVDTYHRLLGELARERGDYETAFRHFQQAVDLAPDDPIYLGNLAIAAAALGRRREAHEAVAWALRQSPTRPEAWLLLGSALDRLGEADRALVAFRKARELGAEGPAADIGEALVLARTGRGRAAREVLAEARRRYPQDPALEAISRTLSASR